MSLDIAEVVRRDECAARGLRVLRRERELRVRCAVATLLVLQLAPDLPRLPWPLVVRIVRLGITQQRAPVPAVVVDLSTD